MMVVKRPRGSRLRVPLPGLIVLARITPGRNSIMCTFSNTSSGLPLSDWMTLLLPLPGGPRQAINRPCGPDQRRDDIAQTQSALQRPQAGLRGFPVARRSGAHDDAAFAVRAPEARHVL